MKRDPTESLMAQFSNFIYDKEISLNDWKMVTSEYMVREEAENTHRFYKSWGFYDEDRGSTTLEFLGSVETLNW